MEINRSNNEKRKIKNRKRQKYLENNEYDLKIFHLDGIGMLYLKNWHLRGDSEVRKCPLLEFENSSLDLKI